MGVNGAGKTTSIAKLARRGQVKGERVILAAADTFRAAAIEQLVLWGERLGVDVVRQGSGADPAAVVFDALEAARHRGVRCPRKYDSSMVRPHAGDSNRAKDRRRAIRAVCS